MSFTPLTRDRRVVPRWHSFRSAVAAGELGIPGAKLDAGAVRDELKVRIDSWRGSPSIVTAAELVETAIVAGADAEAVDAAETLLGTRSQATELVKQQATRLLQRAGRIEPPTATVVAPQDEIARSRERTRSMPRDAFAWTDLARALIAVRKNEEAERCMRIALHLAPHNRHVLRSAARLFLHLNDPERAHDLLLRNRATAFDPWLMAGEIALSSLAERGPKFFKLGTRFVEDGGVSPHHVSELSSAIATVHLHDGHRRARRFFQTSLIDPTGNSMAQAEWAGPNIKGLIQTDVIDHTPNNSEAKAYEAYWNKQFRAIIEACEEWRSEEPFSTRPVEFGSVAALIIDDFPKAEELLSASLRVNPDARRLYNNLAVALIGQGRESEAALILASQLPKADENNIGPITATAGMLALRQGEIKKGLELYAAAINHFKRRGNLPGHALALAYFATETARLELPQAKAILKDAADAQKSIPSVPEAELMLEKAKTWAAARSLRNSAGQSS